MLASIVRDEAVRRCAAASPQACRRKPAPTPEVLNLDFTTDVSLNACVASYEVEKSFAALSADCSLVQRVSRNADHHPGAYLHGLPMVEMAFKY